MHFWELFLLFLESTVMNNPMLVLPRDTFQFRGCFAVLIILVAISLFTARKCVLIKWIAEKDASGHCAKLNFIVVLKRGILPFLIFLFLKKIGLKYFFCNSGLHSCTHSKNTVLVTHTFFFPPVISLAMKQLWVDKLFLVLAGKWDIKHLNGLLEFLVLVWPDHITPYTEGSFSQVS